jgi:outer membrane protein assembly factor BamB
VYVVNHADASLYALSAVNGVPRWHTPAAMFSHMPPVVANGVIYVLLEQDSQIGYLQAVRASDGKWLWSDPLPQYVMSSFSLWDGTIYTTTQSYPDPHSQTLFALDASTGAVRWQINAGPSLSVSGTVLAADDAVYAVTGSGSTALSAFDPHSGGLLWQTQMDGVVRGNLVLAGEYVYLTTDAGTVAALHRSDGTPLWTVHTIGASHLTFANGLLYAAQIDGNHVLALDPASGATRWSFTAAQTVAMAPLYADGVLFFRAFNSLVYALNANTGALLWKQSYEDTSGTEIAVGNGEVFVSSQYYPRAFLNALRARDGALLWRFQKGDLFWSPQVGP